jgi:MOSC domain-containing protein YiiM
MTGRVVAACVSPGRKVEYNGRVVGTGIFKEPVEGRVPVGRLGLEGDRQVDLRVHGGEYKAVYAYPHEHYETWSDELGRDDLAFGQFGENLTTEGLLEDGVHIGDRFRAGTAVLEVTQPRVPCFKLGIKMGDPTFPKRVLQSMRCGFYLRVVEEGEIGAGDAIERIETGPEAVSIYALYHLRFHDYTNRDEIKRVLSIPALSKEWRKELSGVL